MKKRKVKVFIICFLFLVMCSSVINAVAGPMVRKTACSEEHKHNEGCKNRTSSKEEGKVNETNDISENGENPKESEDEHLELELDKENDRGNDLENNQYKENVSEEDKEEEQIGGEGQKEESEKKEEVNEEEKIDNNKLEDREYKNLTTDTFKDVAGPYSFDTILNKYNIFSQDTVTGSHIVGPIVGKKAYSIQEEKGSFKVSDYSNKVPSFIGEIYRIKKGPDSGKVAQVALNYGFEGQAPPGVDLTVKPNLYINETGNQIKVSGEQGNKRYEVVDDERNPTTGEKVPFVGPNNWGNSPILQNDNFIDFKKAFEALNEESKAFANDKNNIIVDESSQYKIDKDGRLNLDVGKNYLIKDASNLLSVNFIYPNGFDPLKNPYPNPTIINIVDNKLSTKIMLGKMQNYLPNMYVDGEPFKGSNNVEGQPALPGGFEDGQIGEMNKIIWNMPNIKTVGEEGRIVRSQLADILGHIVAPNAEFWNYRTEEDTGKFIWIGGNMNGAAIVKSWHGGTMESHYWPYNGEIKAPDSKIAMSVNAKKIFNKGNLDNPKFNFILEYDGESLPDGILNENIPQTVQQEADGSIKFLPITFTKAGKYNFKIKEIQGDDKDIIYDGSEYEVTVTVTVNLVDGKLEYTKEVTKVKDNVSSPVDEIVFVNEKILNFTIEKKDNLTGSLLEGAMFDLYEADESGKPKGEPIIKDITTDSTGKINVSNKVLDYNKLYVLVETKAPDGYMTGENIVFYIKGEEGPYPSVDGVIEIGNSGVVEVLNTKSDEVLPETGGMGTDKFIFAGLGLMLSSLIILRFKLIKG